MAWVPQQIMNRLYSIIEWLENNRVMHRLCTTQPTCMRLVQVLNRQVFLWFIHTIICWSSFGFTCTVGVIVHIEQFKQKMILWYSFILLVTLTSHMLLLFSSYGVTRLTYRVTHLAYRVTHLTWCHSPCNLCHSPHIACRSPHISCRSPHISCHSPHLSCHSPHLSCHTPRLQCHCHHVVSLTSHIVSFTSMQCHSLLVLSFPLHKNDITSLLYQQLMMSLACVVTQLSCSCH